MSDTGRTVERLNIRMLPPGATLPQYPDRLADRLADRIAAKVDAMEPGQAQWAYRDPADVTAGQDDETAPDSGERDCYKSRRTVSDQPGAAVTYLFNPFFDGKMIHVYMAFRGDVLYLALRGHFLALIGGRDYLIRKYHAHVARFDYVANDRFVVAPNASVYVGAFIPFTIVESMDAVAADPALARVVAKARRTAECHRAMRARGIVPPGCKIKNDAEVAADPTMGRPGPPPGPATDAQPEGDVHVVPPLPPPCSPPPTTGVPLEGSGSPVVPSGTAPPTPEGLNDSQALAAQAVAKLTPGDRADLAREVNWMATLHVAVRKRLAEYVPRAEYDDVVKQRDALSKMADRYVFLQERICEAYVLPTDAERLAALAVIADELTS